VSEQHPFIRRPRSAEEFIREAETPSPVAQVDTGPPPWEQARSDVIKPYQLR
jgi:hypothetical protein